jgi:hypothetical protein
MEAIYIRGEKYVVSYTDETASIEGLGISVPYTEDWDYALKSALCKHLNVVVLQFTHYRNAFIRNGMDVGFKPFFQHLGAIKKEHGYGGSDVLTFDGFWCGYYYPQFTVDKTVFDNGKDKITKSIMKNLKIFGND